MMDRVRLGDLLTNDGLKLRFQSIFDISADPVRPFAVEVLAHGPENTNFETSNVLFDYVRLKHEEIAVDRHLVAKALREVASLPADLKISLNVHAVTIEKDRSFGEFLVLAARRGGIALDRLVIEIVEQSRYWNTASMRQAIATIRDRGVAVALDDIGCGFCNYQMIVELRPQYLKLDRYFIHDCPAESGRRAVMRSIHMLATDVGARVIAEGVETFEELDTVRSIGVGLAQGYALGRPVAAQQFHLNPVHA